MEFYDVISGRRSVRSYRPDPVPEASLARIGEAVRLAPSACNLQPWEFRVILDSALRAKICGLSPRRKWMAQAPAIVLALGSPEKAWHRPEGGSIIDIDIGIAMEHFILAAHAEGLGTCWICAYEMEPMENALGIEKPWRLLAMTPLGFPAENPKMPDRRPAGQIMKIIK